MNDPKEILTEQVNKRFVNQKFLEEANLSIGTKVTIMHGSGVDSGKKGTIVDPRKEIKTDGRGVPTNIQGAYHPFDNKKEYAIRLDGGELISMFKERVKKA